jgi:hypothetical protein
VSLVTSIYVSLTCDDEVTVGTQVTLRAELSGEIRNTDDSEYQFEIEGFIEDSVGHRRPIERDIIVAPGQTVDLSGSYDLGAVYQQPGTVRVVAEVRLSGEASGQSADNCTINVVTLAFQPNVSSDRDSKSIDE